jgi:hypothetical protein
MVLCVKAAGPPPTQVPEAPRLWGLCRRDDRARTGDLVVVCELRRAELLRLSAGNRGCLVVKSGRRLQCGTYAGSGLVRWRTPLALGSLRPGPDRPVGHGKDDASLDQPDPLLPKPVRAGSLAAETVNDAGRGRHGVVRGCPLGTGQDCYEWQASGTAGEDDPAHPGVVAPP